MVKDFDLRTEPEKGREGDSFRQSQAGTRRLGTAVVILALIATLVRIAAPSAYMQWPSFRKHCSHKLTVEERARKILKENPLIGQLPRPWYETTLIDTADGHNDLMITIRGRFKNHIYDDFKDKFENGGMPQHVDLPRLDEGLQGGAFWSAFMPCPPSNGTLDFSDENYYQSA
jgi:membrane dipeptidase